MPRKNLPLEIALVACVLIAAFLLQWVLTHTKSPKMPEFQQRAPSRESLTIEDGVVVVAEENDESKSLAIPESYDEHHSALGHAPDWESLDVYQGIVERSEFLHLISNVYSVGEYWKDWFVVEDEYVLIRTHAGDLSKTYQLKFKSEGSELTPERFWRSRDALAEGSAEAPLEGLRIAIDPGHIGGDYAEIEERRMVLKDGAPPIQEGNMTLRVAELLLVQLESLGASAHLVRDANAPVNPFKTKDYHAYAMSKIVTEGSIVTEASVKREAEILFYRAGEILARAELVNHELKPDLVLCLHFNAGGKLGAEGSQLHQQEHFHMILNGAYTRKEMANDDERYKAVLKILQGNHREEAKISAAAAASFRQESGLPPYQYASNSSRAVNVDGNPYLWGRNLVANRLYDCPVLYFEPYLMNGEDSYARMQRGDYEGLGFINGQLRPSIYREYVNAVTKGLVNYYTPKGETGLTEEEEEIPKEAGSQTENFTEVEEQPLLPDDLDQNSEESTELELHLDIR